MTTQRANNQRQSAKCKHKRIRVKNALTTKRHHYNNYADANIDWITLFLLIDDKPDKKAIIRHMYPGVKYHAAMARYRRWTADGKPQQPVTPSAQDNRGGSNAAMTVEEEALFAEHIKSTYLLHGGIVNCTDIRTLAKAYYQKLHPHRLRGVADFKAGGAWICRFMEKHMLTSRTGSQ